MEKHARLSLTPGTAIGNWQARGRYDCVNEAMSRVMATRNAEAIVSRFPADANTERQLSRISKVINA